MDPIDHHGHHLRQDEEHTGSSLADFRSEERYRVSRDSLFHKTQNPSSGKMRETFPTPLELKGAVQGTLLYLGLYATVLIPFQSFSKFFILAKKKKEAKQKEGNTTRISLKMVKYYSHDAMALRGDRTVGNFLEQGLYYLPLYWLHALFVDPSNSFMLAGIYTASRALYPFVFGKRQPILILLSTVPGYLVNAYLFFELYKSASA